MIMNRVKPVFLVQKRTFMLCRLRNAGLQKINRDVCGMIFDFLDRDAIKCCTTLTNEKFIFEPGQHKIFKMNAVINYQAFNWDQGDEKLLNAVMNNQLAKIKTIKTINLSLGSDELIETLKFESQVSISDAMYAVTLYINQPTSNKFVDRLNSHSTYRGLVYYIDEDINIRGDHFHIHSDGKYHCFVTIGAKGVLKVR